MLEKMVYYRYVREQEAGTVASQRVQRGHDQTEMGHVGQGRGEGEESGEAA